MDSQWCRASPCAVDWDGRWPTSKKHDIKWHCFPSSVEEFLYYLAINIQMMGKFSFSAVHSGKNIQVMGKFKKRIVRVYMCNQSICVVYSIYMCNQSICVVYSVYMCIQSICVVYSVYMCIQSICVSPLLFILRRLITSEWSNYAVQGTRAVVSGFLGAWTDPMGNNVQVKEVCNEVRV